MEGHREWQVWEPPCGRVGGLDSDQAWLLPPWGRAWPPKGTPFLWGLTWPPHFWELPCLTAALCPLWVLPAPEELDAWAPGLESLAGPAGAAKGIQGLWAGFVGKGPRGSHSKDEGGGRVSRGWWWYLESSGSSSSGGWAGQLGPSSPMVLWPQRGADVHSRLFHRLGEEAGARTLRAAGSPQPQPV